MFEKCINEAVDSTMFQISSSFVCSFRMVFFWWSSLVNEAVSNGGLLLSVAYDFTCFMKFLVL